MKQIVKPASLRLETAREDATKKLANDLPDQTSLLVTLDGLSTQFEKIKKLGVTSE